MTSCRMYRLLFITQNYGDQIEVNWMASHVDRVKAVTNKEKVWAGKHIEKRNIWKTMKTI